MRLHEAFTLSFGRFILALAGNMFLSAVLFVMWFAPPDAHPPVWNYYYFPFLQHSHGDAFILPQYGEVFLSFVSGFLLMYVTVTVVASAIRWGVSLERGNHFWMPGWLRGTPEKTLGFVLVLVLITVLHATVFGLPGHPELTLTMVQDPGRFGWLLNFIGMGTLLAWFDTPLYVLPLGITVLAAYAVPAGLLTLISQTRAA